MLKVDLNKRIYWEDFFNHSFFKNNNNIFPNLILKKNF
jgi:hypothetical protein